MFYNSFFTSSSIQSWQMYRQACSSFQGLVSTAHVVIFILSTIFTSLHRWQILFTIHPSRIGRIRHLLLWLLLCLRLSLRIFCIVRYCLMAFGAAKCRLLLLLTLEHTKRIILLLVLIAYSLFFHVVYNYSSSSSNHSNINFFPSTIISTEAP